MRHVLTVVLIFAAMLDVFLHAQQKPQYDVQRCTPKLIKKTRPPKDTKPATRKGERSTGYAPVISFEILESGEVANARVKRSCGFANVDKHSLNWVRGMKYNKRPGCGTIQSETVVTIDWK